MKIALSWLKDHIDFKESAEEICKKLTASGLEVEGLEDFELVKGGLKGVVVGEVVTCDPHPDADKLRVTSINIGAEENLPIVCGAPNVAAGQKVVVATVGTTLYPSPEEPFKIKRAKIRGVESLGMLCGSDEIGLGKGIDGILVLDAEIKAGTPAAEIFNLSNEQIIEIGLTPNRADATSHFGVARDVEALTGNKVKNPEVELSLKGDAPISVSIENETACARYAGLSIKNLKVKESPDWLRNKLKSLGLKPKNNVVDVTNYILHDLGQPMHAFDASKIKGDKVIIKNGFVGTKFQTLDEEKRELKAEDLMICDGENTPLCIAGVMGGLESSVNESTTSIFLESAYFSADSVRKTSLIHGIKTDSSFRFERGTDVNMVLVALKKAAKLIVELCEGEIVGDIAESYPSKVADFEFDVRVEKIQKLIGVEIPETRIIEILNSLDIKTSAIENGVFQVIVPSYRVDVQREADISEEVLRIYGFENVPISKDLSSKFLAQNNNQADELTYGISDYLVANGFYEITTNSLTKPEYADWIDGITNDESVYILNKLSVDHEVMRQSLMFSGLEVIKHNINRKAENLKVFEFGKTYHRIDGEYVERKVLSVWLTGQKSEESWYEKSSKLDFHNLSNAVLGVLEKTGLKFKEQSNTVNKNYSAGLDLNLHQGLLVSLGAIQGKLLSKIDIDQPVFYAEFDYDLVLKQISKKLVAKELSKYPEVRRDLSVVLKKSTSFDEVRKVAQKVENRLITAVNVFDVYEGENLGEDKKSYSVSFTLQDKEKTLKDSVIDKVMNKLIDAFEKNLEAVIRR